MLAFAPSSAHALGLADWADTQGRLCATAIAAAETRYSVPPGLLLAIGKVESGRPLPPAGALLPWPWTTNAAGVGAFYDTKAAALDGARGALRSSRNLDVGCMQISLLHHPGAFAALEDAFDPGLNADYAARFLRELQAGPAAGDWGAAAGMYHSQTPWRAAGYRAKVQAILTGLPLPRGGPTPFYARAVQRGAIRFELGDGAVRIMQVSARRRGPIQCQPLPGGAVQCH